MNAVLVLNADYTLLEIVPWQKAVSMLVSSKVRVVEEYAGKFLRSTSITMGFPAVVARIKYVRHQKRITLSRKNILARDSFTCKYCGIAPKRSDGSPKLEALTIDHVVPRAQAKKGWVHLPWSGQRVRITSWENVLTACAPCNGTKADRTPAQAKMKVARYPRTPTSLDIAWMNLYRHTVPSEWEDYLPESSPWRDYWNGELVD